MASRLSQLKDYGKSSIFRAYISSNCSFINFSVIRRYTLWAHAAILLWYFDRLFGHSSHRAMNGTDLALVTGHLEGRIG